MNDDDLRKQAEQSHEYEYNHGEQVPLDSDTYILGYMKGYRAALSEIIAKAEAIMEGMRENGEDEKSAALSEFVESIRPGGEA